jgi:pyruvate dehydrogenase E2 component (dihydrolipoamide acetyltransferase)
MAEIFMPKMGDAMTEGKVLRWYKQPGEPVKKGEPVLEIETDKVNLDLEAEVDGVLDEIKVQEGATAPVGATLATTRAEGEARAAKGEERESERARERGKGEGRESERARERGAKGEERGAKGQERDSERARERGAKDEEQEVEGEEREEEGEEREETAAARQQAPRQARPHLRAVESPPPPSGKSRERGGVRSSPLARKMAKELGVDLASIQGSGPAGRIIAADISGAARRGGTQIKEAPAPDRGERLSERERVPLQSRSVPLNAMRRTIAKRLVESLGPIPHFYLTIDVDVTNLLALRSQLNEVENVKTSVNDFVIRAAALALRHHPNVNASFAGDAIQQHGEVHIGVAVATAEGLITPIVRNADQQSIPEIARVVKDLAARAKNRKLKPDEYQGSTMTISNLGMFGIDEFSAIINPPNAAILAVGTAAPHPVAIERQVVVRDRMKVTMSCDHRVIDGAAGAEYLQTLRQYLEQPVRLIL